MHAMAQHLQCSGNSTDRQSPLVALMPTDWTSFATTQKLASQEQARPFLASSVPPPAWRLQQHDLPGGGQRAARIWSATLRKGSLAAPAPTTIHIRSHIHTHEA